MLESKDNNSLFIGNPFNTAVKEETTFSNEETENNFDSNETTKSSTANYRIQPNEKYLNTGILG